MSDASTAKPVAEKTESKTSTDSANPSKASESSTAPAQKSARESVGGKTEVHYGYFSNVKTPEYRSGWDSIWGGSKPNGAGRERATARPARAKSPVRLTLAFDDLPEAVQDELRSAAGAALKEQSRLDLARRERVGAVSWTIECEVRR
ncbi:MAG: hypothetical protein OXI22_18125 [Defluviicoccus sp.]|nr:hypothetical protein [Defluviicoccus sp.]MDE0385806.1 hypothetical protein [Defluviicoccus sp.]